MPAPAAPPAPTVAPSPAIPTEIKIPKLEQLTAPKTDDPPPGEDTPPVAPVVPAAPEPPEIPILETEIIQRPGATTAAPVNTPKGASDFARERQQKKQEKADAQALQAELDQHKLTLVEKETALEKLQRELEEERKQREIDRKLAADSKKELEKLQASYFDSNQLTFNPQEDAEFQTAQTQMLDVLRSNLPIRVAGATDEASGQQTEKRVFFDAMMQQKNAAGGLANMLDAYTIAKQSGNDAGIQRAVSAMAQWLGASNVNLAGQDETKWKLLPTTDPVFRQIENALEQAAPLHVKRVERYTAIQKDGPRLAQEQFTQRETQIRQTLAADLFMSPQMATERLRADPNDTQAMLATLVSQVPALKDIAERALAEVAPAFAAMGERLYIPGLSSNDPAQIAAHRQREAQTRGTLAKAMRMAVVGQVIGPAFRSVLAQRDAAEARAEAASLLTNPLPPGSKPGDGGAAPLPQLQTEIVTGR